MDWTYSVISRDSPRRIAAWTKTWRHAIETEDTVLCMLEYENGAVGTIYFSTGEAGQATNGNRGHEGHSTVAGRTAR